MRIFCVILLLASLALNSCNAVRCVLTCHTLAGDYTSVEI
ncbi:uncharacterized protein LOC108142312 [Drosophila elegans]|nr:uncharacterized protein LOC108142312 [Drosophila elegans]